MLKRVSMAALVALLVALPLTYWTFSGAGRYHGLTRQPIAAEHVAAVADFAAQLGVPAPKLYRSTVPNTGMVTCAPDHDCTIRLGVPFGNAFWQDHPQAARALLAHETTHVLQAGGQRGRYVLPALYVVTVALVVAAQTGLAWWLCSWALLAAVAVGAVALNIVYLDDLLSLTLYGALALSLGVTLLCVGTIRLGTGAWAKAAARVAAFSLVALLIWAALRGLETGDKALERDADVMAACLTSPEATKAALGELGKSGATRWHVDLYHPTPEQRLAAIDALDTPAKLQAACHAIQFNAMNGG